ncbi:MAG TPA: FHA domain-containing protein [Gemmatimonadaceae bacterium]|jgi:pSer/pThr/pTyr-binding forkhead associated (FHA) protein
MTNADLNEARVNRCGFCGRENEGESRFCIDCGKPIVASGARVIEVASIMNPGGARMSSPASGIPATRISEAAKPAPGTKRGCPFCGASVHTGLPFCPQCGGRLSNEPAPPPAPALTCDACGKPVRAGDQFCPRCGAKRVAATPPTPPGGTQVFSARATQSGPKLALLGDTGQITQQFTLGAAEGIVGRVDGEIRFPDDVFMSPVHAQFAVRDGELFVRDLGSRNGTWVFLDAPMKLSDGDAILVGSQILRFKRLGYPGPHPPEADATRRLGSLLPHGDIAVLQQLRADGSVRDSLHLSPGRTVFLGRDKGDWVFPYDQTMSGSHAEVRNEDMDFVLLDAGSRNGVAVSVRGERAVRVGQRVLMGDQILRLESM